MVKEEVNTDDSVLIKEESQAMSLKEEYGEIEALVDVNEGINSKGSSAFSQDSPARFCAFPKPALKVNIW